VSSDCIANRGGEANRQVATPMKSGIKSGAVALEHSSFERSEASPNRT
jgi:hypothetical protein